MALDTSSLDRFLGVLMGEAVMKTAEGTEFFQTGFATVGPVDLVVDVAPPGGSMASLVGAMAVPGDDGSSQGGGNDPRLATHVDDLGFSFQNNSMEGGVAGELADRFDGEYMSALGLMEATGQPL